MLASLAPVRRRTQKIGALALVPFALLLIAHSFWHEIPLFPRVVCDLRCRPAGDRGNLEDAPSGPPRSASGIRRVHYFLFPLFLSITLLTSEGFFDRIQGLIRTGVDAVGRAHVAYAQFLGSTFLSAILDNNVVADFALRGLHGLDVGTLHLFAMAQIAAMRSAGAGPTSAARHQ